MSERISLSKWLVAFMVLFIFCIVGIGMLWSSIFAHRIKIENIAHVSQESSLISPSFSPDGNLLAFINNTQLCVNNLTTENRECMTLEYQESDVRWVTDSEIIYAKTISDTLISTTRRMSTQFWIFDIYTGQEKPLSSVELPGKIKHYSLSPSRNRLAFVTNEMFKNERDNIYILDLETDTLLSLPFPTNGSCMFPTWFKNDEKIITICAELTASNSSPSYRIWQFDTLTSSSKPISGKLRAPLPIYGLSISPNGKWLIYPGEIDTWPPSYNYYVAPIEDEKIRFDKGYKLDFLPLTLTQYYFGDLPSQNISWSSDSKQIAFSGNLRTDNGFKRGTWLVTLQ